MKKLFKNTISIFLLPFIIAGCTVKQNDGILTKSIKHTTNTPLYLLIGLDTLEDLVLMGTILGTAYIINPDKFAEKNLKKEKTPQEIKKELYLKRVEEAKKTNNISFLKTNGIYYKKFLNNDYKSREIISFDIIKDNLTHSNIRKKISDKMFKSQFLSDYINAAIKKENTIIIYSFAFNRSVFELKEENEILNNLDTNDYSFFPAFVEYDKNDKVVSVLTNYATYDKSSQNLKSAKMNFVIYNEKESERLNSVGWKVIKKTYVLAKISKDEFLKVQ